MGSQGPININTNPTGQLLPNVVNMSYSIDYSNLPSNQLSAQSHHTTHNNHNNNTAFNGLSL